MFTSPTIKNEYTLFVLKDEIRETGTRSFSNEKIGLTKGGYPIQVIKETYPDIQIVPVKNNLDGFGKLLKGEIYAVGTGRLTGLYNLNKHGIDNIVPITDNFAGKGVGIAVRKGNPELLNKLNSAIDNLRKNGELDRIKQAWLSQYTLKEEGFWSDRNQLLAGAIVLAMGIVFFMARTNRKKRDSQNQ